MADAPYTSSRNSFHLARFLLAALVIFSHSFTLLRQTTPLSALSGGLMNENALAVDGFLTISGFLICQSAVRSRNVLIFLRNRALRLLPGLLFALVFSALFIGGLAYTGDFSSYVRLGENGPFSWLLNWATMNVQPEQWEVTGVFASNPTTGMNVSLWSVKFQVFLYLLMALLILTTLHRHRPVYIVFYAFFLILRVLLETFGLRLWDLYDTRWWVLSQWNYDRFTQTGLFFFTGTLLYAYRDRLPRRWYLAVIAVLALTLSLVFSFVPARVDAAAGTPSQLLWQLAYLPLRLVYYMALPYLVVYLASSPLCASFSRLGDMSYGMFLYSYPLQQMIIHLFPQIRPLPLFLLSMLVVLPFAAYSWRRIESPALRCKSPRTTSAP